MFNILFGVHVSWQVSHNDTNDCQNAICLSYIPNHFMARQMFLKSTKICQFLNLPMSLNLNDF